ncbi:MAG: hypothetical protein ACOYMA_02480 [Bacteroidia bacterium]
MNFKSLVIPLFFIVLGCTKTTPNGNVPCDETRYYYHIPDSLKNWFNRVLDSAQPLKNYEAKSSKGLSETMTVNSNYNAWYQSQMCGASKYYNSQYNYASTLYNNRFSLLLAFQTNFRPLVYTWNEGAIKVDTGKFNIIIHTIATSNSDTKTHYLDLKQSVGINYSTHLKAIYYDSDYFCKDSVECDTCIQWKGIYLQDNITYNDVYRYVNPMQYGNVNSIKEFLIDKKYGVIQFTNRDNTIWKISPFK